jgi:hypothetical protein
MQSSDSMMHQSNQIETTKMEAYALFAKGEKFPTSRQFRY